MDIARSPQDREKASEEIDPTMYEGVLTGGWEAIRKRWREGRSKGRSGQMFQPSPQFVNHPALRNLFLGMMVFSWLVTLVTAMLTFHGRSDVGMIMSSTALPLMAVTMGYRLPDRWRYCCGSAGVALAMGGLVVRFW